MLPKSARRVSLGEHITAFQLGKFFDEFSRAEQFFNGKPVPQVECVKMLHLYTMRQDSPATREKMLNAMQEEGYLLANTNNPSLTRQGYTLTAKAYEYHQAICFNQPKSKELSPSLYERLKDLQEEGGYNPKKYGDVKPAQIRDNDGKPNNCDLPVPVVEYIPSQLETARQRLTTAQYDLSVIEGTIVTLERNLKKFHGKVATLEARKMDFKLAILREECKKQALVLTRCREEVDNLKKPSQA
jgi:hypothetical protein